VERYQGRGCWPGRASGRIHWVEAVPTYDRAPVADRAAEISRLRAATSAALAELERLTEEQPTLGAKVVLQAYREALQDQALTGRVTMLIDVHGLPAPAAVVEGASLVAQVMSRSEALEDRAQLLPVAARWLARRIDTPELPPDTILAAAELSPLELLDRRYPAIVGSGEPGVQGETPLVWGVEGVNPDWAGRIAHVDGETVALEPREEVTQTSYTAVRRAVLDTARRMKRDGLVRLTSGNVSCRVPGLDQFAITPSGMEYDSLEPEDICILDLKGRLVDGRRRPSTEAPLHRLTYQRRPDVFGVVHTHSIYASAFACTGQSMPVISTELAGLVGGTIRCAPYAKSGTEEFAVTALDALGMEDVALLFQNHGVMAVGASLKEAYDVALGLEEAAMIYYLARQMGEPVILPEEERRRIFRVMHTTYGQPKEGHGKEE